MRLDRDLQRTILEQLKGSYPNLIDVATIEGDSGEHLQANLFYLEERGLVYGSHEQDSGSPIVMARITAEGLDFLEGDGGVGAILGTN